MSEKDISRADRIRIGIDAILIIVTIVLMIQANKMMDTANKLSIKANTLMVQANNIALNQVRIGTEANRLIDVSNGIQGNAIKVQRELVQATMDAEEARIVLQDKKAACVRLESDLLNPHNTRLSNNNKVIEFFRRSGNLPYVFFDENGTLLFHLAERANEIYLTVDPNLYDVKKYNTYLSNYEKGFIDLLMYTDAASEEYKLKRIEFKGYSLNLTKTDRLHIDLWRKKKCYDFKT